MRTVIKKIILPLFIAFAALAPAVASAQLAGGAFGGQIVFELPCDTGLLLFISGGSGIQTLMWLFGELPYLSFVPPHIGQWILGVSGGNAVCAIGPLTYGAGSIILFHGSSL